MSLHTTRADCSTLDRLLVNIVTSSGTPESAVPAGSHRRARFAARHVFMGWLPARPRAPVAIGPCWGMTIDDGTGSWCRLDDRLERRPNRRYLPHRRRMSRVRRIHGHP